MQEVRKEYELNKNIQTILLQNDVFIFKSEQGKKGVTDSNTVRLKNQITATDDVRPDRNHNIWTGKGDIADVDLSEVYDFSMPDDSDETVTPIRNDSVVDLVYKNGDFEEAKDE